MSRYCSGPVRDMTCNDSASITAGSEPRPSLNLAAPGRGTNAALPIDIDRGSSFVIPPLTAAPSSSFFGFLERSKDYTSSSFDKLINKVIK